MSAPAEAIAQEVVWKNAELRQFCLTLVVKALTAGVEFTTDLVPDSARGDGNGMAGSAVTILQDASVIQPVGHYSQGEWYPKKARSTRPEAKGRYLNVYKLTSLNLAVSYLQRNGHPLATPVQTEFFSAPAPQAPRPEPILTT